MRDPRLGPIVDLHSASEMYGEGYYRGENSGYPSEGYALHHPDWNAWLDVLQILKPSGVLLDVGCAHGYLVDEARRRGYSAFGVDVSPFALRQEPSFRPWLVEAGASPLPFADQCADVVALFDLLEHLPDPLAGLREARRVLKPDGVLVGTTPDPIFFDRAEKTHFSERPPSFWCAALEDLGFRVRFRFSGESYNFQFLAASAASPAAAKLDILQHDYFALGSTDILQVESPERSLSAALRAGWGPLSEQGRSIGSFPASVYLLNRAPLPVSLRIEVRLRHTPDFSTLRLRLNSHALHEVDLDSEQAHRTIQPGSVVLPAGGHHLFLDLSPGGPRVTVETIRIQAEASSRSALIQSLPFDLHQRYHLCAEVAQILGPGSILDIGGYLGDEQGHLAVSHDFFQTGESCSPAVIVTDVRQCDHPEYFRAPALEQPFADLSFDLVLSLDVLEHLPSSERVRFLAELDRLSRQWILLGAPFSSPAVEEAEKRLAQSLMGARRFLQEHRELGLPELAPVRDFYLSRGYSVLTLPNGYLPSWLYWQTGTQHYFGLNDCDIARMYNSLYSRFSYPSDNREPAYRHILLVAKSNLAPAVRERLERLSSSPGQKDGGLLDVAADPLYLDLHERAATLGEKRRKALIDVQFLINERQKLIDLLKRELEIPLWRQVLRRLRNRLR